MPEVFGELIALTGEKAATVDQAAGEFGRFIAPVQAIAVAGAFTYCGLRAKTQYGMVIEDVLVGNVDAADGLYSLRTGIGVAPGGASPALVAGVRRRDAGLTQGKVTPASCLAWIAQSTIEEGDSVTRGWIKGGASYLFQPNWIVNQNEDFYCVSVRNNIFLMATFRGIEFYSSRARAAYLARMG